MAWRLAKGLETLRRQVNAQYPTRSKASDGTRGDSSHAARKSDHNEDGRGIVHALDLTHDPRVGFDSYKFADWLLARQDARLSYIISDGRIGSGPGGQSPGKWRKYTGVNPHDHHVHISIRGPGYEDVDHDWNIGTTGVPVASAAQPRPTLKIGSVGVAVRELQIALRLPPDAIFGKATKAAVVKAQQSAGLVGDGIVGPQTWKVIDVKHSA